MLRSPLLPAREPNLQSLTGYRHVQDTQPSRRGKAATRRLLMCTGTNRSNRSSAVCQLPSFAPPFQHLSAGATKTNNQFNSLA